MSTVETLIEALQARDLPRVEALIAEDPALASSPAPGGASALMLAAYHGFSEAVSVLAAAHAGLSIQEAAAIGDLGRVKTCLAERPQSVDELGGDGWTPLHLAAFFGQAEVASLLVAAGASVEASSSNATQNQPLHAALAGVRSPATLAVLIAAGADVNARAAGGITPLHLAAARGDLEVIVALRHHGAHPQALTDQGQTPADLAAERGQPAAAAALRS